MEEVIDFKLGILDISYMWEVNISYVKLTHTEESSVFNPPPQAMSWKKNTPREYFDHFQFFFVWIKFCHLLLILLSLWTPCNMMTQWLLTSWFEHILLIMGNKFIQLTSSSPNITWKEILHVTNTYSGRNICF